jgi:uncharacterized protein YbbC (DUF1343 family)/arylsulfatase A-like enzyme
MRLRAVVTALLLLAAWPSHAQNRPNVVLVYADDFGYGDVSAYGARRVRTPNIDRIAREGIRFTDAHSTAATCTPSRYALLTGEYAWRKPGTGILPGDAAMIIEPGRPTLASVFQQAGYATGVVGKWHLGLGPAGGPNWNAEIRPAPADVGFDHAFIMAATGDRVPTVYVENRKVVGLDPADPIRVSYKQPVGDWPTGRANPDLLKLHPSAGHDQTIVNGISRIGYMTGGRSALWKDEEIADVFTRQAVAFIERNRSRPFFLYFALHDPHVPRVPHPRFAGATPMGPRGDAIAQADWCVGEILATLDRLELARDTIVIMTSDNGPVVDDGYRDEAVTRLGDHKPSGPFRGGKYSNFEGGTRVPFMVRWPGRVRPGTSRALVSQADLIASFASLLGSRLPDGAAPDSENMLPALLGASRSGRAMLVEQAGALSLRQGRWKYIAPGKGPKVNLETNTELGNDPEPQLYDLAVDSGERHNLATSRPEKTRELAARLDAVRRQSPKAAAVVRPGIEVFLENMPAALRGRRVGLITNQAAVNRARRSDIDLIARSKQVRLVALFAAEHGIRGDAAAGAKIADDRDRKTGVPIHSLYKTEDRGPTPEMLANVDALVYDLLEVGGRTWTYVSTMALSMQAAAKKGIPFVVLDRPNPIGGEIVEGALLDPAFKSFVGMYPIPARHGMTVGELATMFNTRFGIGADLIVVRAANWTRSQWLADTGLPWTNPSPNLRSPAALNSYPGTVYFEGTNLTEGRGTDRPFEQIGASWLDAQALAKAMNATGLPGVRFEAITMAVAKTAAKFPGETIPAIRFDITDREAYRPVRTALLLIDEIRRQHPREFAWGKSIDRLTGSDKARLAIDSGTLPDLLQQWDREAAAFAEGRKPFLLYR